ncbi:hypothetical protein DE146DRAFT_630479 [Phaeosphaeria sp. MPI-PUGE-AT-0046c]|nr:hypothetical protein DE146DRAFT_630479 [Phaeosphaeria sp. MPI-PUGE-AT-0046c]
MASTYSMQQLLRAPASCRTALFPPSRPQNFRNFALLAPQFQLQSRAISLPRVLSPSFWGSMIPKPFKRSATGDSDQLSAAPASPRSREWNPATPYIVLGLLVGSQAIQVLWLKQDQAHAKRRAEARIGLLREVIERVQRGEEVDVGKALGSGDQAREEEWAEMLKDMENEEMLFQSKKKRKAMRQAAELEAAKSEVEKSGGQEAVVVDGEGRVKVESVNGVRFY